MLDYSFFLSCWITLFWTALPVILGPHVHLLWTACRVMFMRPQFPTCPAVWTVGCPKVLNVKFLFAVMSCCVADPRGV
jgi:hypothetical protein